jgi:hypothetical protein
MAPCSMFVETLGFQSKVNMLRFAPDIFQIAEFSVYEQYSSEETDRSRANL